MIGSRTHAVLDFGLSAGLIAIALAGRGRVRYVAGIGASLVVTTAALTDYEGGFSPRLRLQEHRAVDAVTGLTLGIAGLGLRSPALVAAGSAGLALAVLGDAHACGGPPDMSYPPLDIPKRLTRDVWIVDSVLGPGIPVRMTVLRLRDGSLLLHSPTRLTPSLRQALEGLGPIRHLVAPNLVHWVFVKSWQDVLPDAVVYAAPGLRRRLQVRRSGLRIDRDLSDTPPPAWDGQVEQAVIPGGGGFTEVAMFHRMSRSLLMTDLIQNLEPAKLPWLLRPVANWLGNVPPQSRAPAHLRALMALRRRAGAAPARRVVAWSPERIVVTHGAPIERDAPARLRTSLAWLTG